MKKGTKRKTYDEQQRVEVGDQERKEQKKHCRMQNM
jgi:hypothetical protein